MATRYECHGALPWRPAEVILHAHIRLGSTSLSRAATVHSVDVAWTSTHVTTARSAIHATAIARDAIEITMTTDCRLDAARVLRASHHERERDDDRRDARDRADHRDREDARAISVCRVTDFSSSLRPACSVDFLA